MVPLLHIYYLSLVTHRGVYQHKSDEVAHEEEPEWSKGKCAPYF